MTQLIGFALKNWKWFALIGCVLGIVLYMNSLYSTISSLEEDVEDWRTKYNEEHAAYLIMDAQHKSNNKVLTLSIDDQNKKVQELNGQLKLAEEQIELATANVTNVKRDYEQRITDILRETTPETCEAAFLYLVDGIDELRWSTK